MRNDFWRNYNFRVEPWGNDYEPPTQLDGVETSKSEVDPTVETEVWCCLKPTQELPLPNRLVFVDGCRRIDAALVGGEGNTVAYGVFGTIAVGTVVVDRSIPHARCTQLTIRRIVGFGGNQKAEVTHIPCPLGSRAELVYEPIEPCAENNPQTRELLIQNAMIAAEAQLAVEQVVGCPDTLVIRDGRLPYQSPVLTLGYVKTMHNHYLSEKFAALLWQLSPGERSPIFLIKEKNRPCYSWYLKSGNDQSCHQRLGYHGLHGIVRLELSSEVPLEKAIEIANQSTSLIPQYASHPSRDPRAPQNLIPVGALEHELSRRMGDAALIKRRVQNFLASLGRNI